MRNAKEISSYFHRDDLDKWDLENVGASVVLKHRIVFISSADGRLGVQLARAGTNVSGPTMLFFAVQDTHPANKSVMYRAGLIDFATGASPVNTPVYLSGTTAGEITLTRPSTAIVVGHVADQDKVMLSLGGLSTMAVDSAILDQYEYWVNAAGDLAGRQFSTADDAISQILVDTPINAAVTLNFGEGQTHALPLTLPASRVWTLRGGVIDLNFSNVPADGAATVRDCKITGQITISNGASFTLVDVVATNAEITGDAGFDTTDVTLDLTRVSGSVYINHTNPFTSGVINTTARQCTFETDATTTNFATIRDGTTILESCYFHAANGSGHFFVCDFAVGKNATTTISFSDCTVIATAATGVQLINLVNTTPTVLIRGGFYKVDNIGATHTTDGMPFMDLKNRGSVASMYPSASQRPTFSAGRSVSVYSPTVGAYFGTGNTIEFEYNGAPDGQAYPGVIQMDDGANTEVVIPDGEAWRIDVYRVLELAGAHTSDLRTFLVRRTGAVMTIQASAAVDPHPLGVQVGQSNIIAGATTGSIEVTTASALNTDATMTAHIMCVQNKAAF